MKAQGATLVAQDDAAAQAWGSARKAIDDGHVDVVLPIERIASTLVRITAPSRPPDATIAPRTIGAQLFDRRRSVPYEVEAVHRAMDRVIGAIEELCPERATPPHADVHAEEDGLAIAIARELRPVAAAAGRALVIDCAQPIASFAIEPEVVRDLTRRLLLQVLAASAGSVGIRISPLRLFLQIVVTGEQPVQQAVPTAASDPDDLRALHALVKPLRGHVLATRRQGKVEYAIWLPRARAVGARGHAASC
jgi:hypothetical protein